MKIFDSVLVTKPKRNVFDLSHEVKLTCNMGELIPILCEEVLPGDTWNVNSEVLTRFMPLLAPVMHRIDVYVHYFYVPNKIIDPNFEDFMEGDEINGLQNLVPLMRINGTTDTLFAKGLLPDYMGIPITDGKTVDQDNDILAHPFLAYVKVWNDYYRDQNQQTEVDLETIVTDLLADPADVAANTALTLIRHRAWEKDYFTSALPWAQKGNPVLPLPTSIPITFQTGFPTMLKNMAGVEANADATLYYDGDAPAAKQLYMEGINDTLAVDNADSLLGDLSGVTFDVNDLRRTIKLQEWMEKNARMGNRYIELVLAHFGVKVPDYRLDRPEYLGGMKNPVVISEVLQTAESRSVAAGTEDDLLTPVGNLKGHGVSIGKSNGISKFFPEHGWILGILSVMPRTQYSQGIARKFLKVDKEDYYWPEFAQLGEQEISIKELWVDYENAQSTSAWGYQQRYAEYKFINSRVCGEFRDTLEYWGCQRTFDTSPSLNETFITADAEDALHRIFAVDDPNEDKIIIQCINNIKAVRPIPYFNVPTF